MKTTNFHIDKEHQLHIMTGTPLALNMAHAISDYTLPHSTTCALINFILSSKTVHAALRAPKREKK